MFTHTKIICTLGPASNSLEKILELIDAGMDVARLNFSHGTHEQHLKTISYIKKARKQVKKPLAIMLDTKGPEIRVGKLINDQIEVTAKQKLKLISTDATKEDEIPIKPFEVLKDINLTQKILFDDGYIIAHVVEKHDDYVIIEAQNTGVIKSSKSVNIPNVSLPLPAVTKSDIDDLMFGCKNDIDIIAASFIRSQDHILEIRKILEDEGVNDILIVAKIECSEGVENFDEIAEVSDGIMVARGDLGVEVDLSIVPKLQKAMINKCYDACKPVVIATQMLESMITNPRPTRAEVSDVANAIYDSASAVMLSAETAAGKYPIETVIQMKKIIYEAEQDFNYKNFFYKQSHAEIEDIPSSVAIAAVKTAYNSNATSIFAITRTGFTARLLTRLRPAMPIVVLTKNEKKYHQLAFNWGITPVFSAQWKTEREAFGIMSHFAIDNDFISFGDLIVLISAYPFDKKGFTNMMIVESIGNILVRGYKAYGEKVKGKIVKILQPDQSSLELAKDKIIVIKKVDDSYLSIMQKAKAIILENSKSDRLSENYAISVAEKYNLNLIIRAKGAFEILEDDDFVHLDPKKALIFKPSDEN